MAKKLKATCIAHPDIAFIKYWGKKDEKIRIPKNNSISMILSKFKSTCTVEFDKNLKKDQIFFKKEKQVTKRGLQRIKKVLNRVRKKAKENLKAKIVTQNNFPKGVGIASSGSGLSAVTMAAASAMGLNLTKKELSILARLASGTACRCVQDGFVEWKKGVSHNSSYSHQLFSPDWWKIADVVAIVSKKMKKTSSTSGHNLAKTSPFYQERLKNLPKKIKDIKKAIKNKNFSLFGSILEKEALNFHAICLTSNPPLLYWNPTTLAIMRKVQQWRNAEHVEAYFSLDAGPTAHIICQKKDAHRIKNKLKTIKGITKVSINYPSKGARIINKHLF